MRTPQNTPPLMAWMNAVRGRLEFFIPRFLKQGSLLAKIKLKWTIPGLSEGNLGF